MQTWLNERRGKSLNVSISFKKQYVKQGEKIPTLEHVAYVFELTSFSADVLGKLIKPRIKKKKKITR